MPKGPGEHAHPGEQTVSMPAANPEKRQVGKNEEAGRKFMEGASSWFSNARKAVAEAVAPVAKRAAEVAAMAGYGTIGGAVRGAQETKRWAREDATDLKKSVVAQGVVAGAEAAGRAGERAVNAADRWAREDALNMDKSAAWSGVKTVGRGAKAGAEFAAGVGAMGVIGAYRAAEYAAGKAVEGYDAAKRGVQAGKEAIGRGVQAGKEAVGRGVDAVNRGAEAVQREAERVMNGVDQAVRQAQADVRNAVDEAQMKYNAAKNVARAVAGGAANMFNEQYQAQKEAQAANLEQQWWNHINEMRMKSPAERAQVYAGMNPQQKAQYDATVMSYLNTWRQRAAEQQAQQARAQQQTRGGYASQASAMN